MAGDGSGLLNPDRVQLFKNFTPNGEHGRLTPGSGDLPRYPGQSKGIDNAWHVGRQVRQADPNTTDEYDHGELISHPVIGAERTYVVSWEHVLSENYIGHDANTGAKGMPLLLGVYISYSSDVGEIVTTATVDPDIRLFNSNGTLGRATIIKDYVANSDPTLGPVGTTSYPKGPQPILKLDPNISNPDNTWLNTWFIDGIANRGARCWITLTIVLDVTDSPVPVTIRIGGVRITGWPDVNTYPLTASATIPAGTFYVPVDTTGGAVTVTLPDTLNDRRSISIVDVAGTAFTHNITVASAALVNGSATQVISVNRGSIDVLWDADSASYIMI